MSVLILQNYTERSVSVRVTIKPLRNFLSRKHDLNSPLYNDGIEPLNSNKWEIIIAEFNYLFNKCSSSCKRKSVFSRRSIRIPWYRFILLRSTSCDYPAVFVEQCLRRMEYIIDGKPAQQTRKWKMRVYEVAHATGRSGTTVTIDFRKVLRL